MPFSHFGQVSQGALSLEWGERFPVPRISLLHVGREPLLYISSLGCKNQHGLDMKRLSLLIL